MQIVIPMRFVTLCGLSLLLSSSTDAFSPFARPIFNILNSKTALNYASSSIHDASDPYVILNLEPGVDIKEIKKAYRKMALKYHPDATSGTERSEEEKQKANDTFAKVNAAYAFLTGKSNEMPGADSGKESQKKTHQRHHKTHPSRHYNFHHQEPHKYRPTTKTSRQKATESSSFDDSYFSHSGDRNKRRECEAQGRPYHPSATTHGYDSNGNTVPRRRKEASVAHGINFNWGGSVSDNLSPPPMENSMKKSFSQSQTQEQSSFFKRGDTVYIVHGEHNGKCGPITSICSNILKIEVSSTMSIFVEERHVLSRQAYMNRKVAEAADYPRPSPPSPSPPYSRSSASAVQNVDIPSSNSTFIESLKIKYNISDTPKNVKKPKENVRPNTSEKKVTKKTEVKIEEYSDFINDEGINILEYSSSEIEKDTEEEDAINIEEDTTHISEGDVVRIIKGQYVGVIGMVMSVYPNIVKLDIQSGNVFIEKESLETLDSKDVFTKIKRDDPECSKTMCANFPGDLSDEILASFLEKYQTSDFSREKSTQYCYEVNQDRPSCQTNIENVKDLRENDRTSSNLDCHGTDWITDETDPITQTMLRESSGKSRHELVSETNTEIFELPTSYRKKICSSAILSPKRIAKLALALCFTLMVKRF